VDKTLILKLNLFLLFGLIGTGKLFDVRSRRCRAVLQGHEGDVSKVTMSVQTAQIIMVTTPDRIQPTRLSVVNG